LIRDQDLFGHEIRLNFNNKGDSHRTFIGGVVSLVIKVCMLAYVLYNFKKMVFREDDTLNNIIGLSDLRIKGDVKFKDMDLNPFFVFKKQLMGNAPLFLNETTSRYITVRFS